MQTPIQKLIARLKKDGCDNEGILGYCQELLEEERKMIESAFANGYLKTKSAKAYYDDLYDPMQLELFNGDE